MPPLACSISPRRRPLASVKAPGLVAEQLGLEQVVRQRCAVDFDQRTFAPRSGVVQNARGKALAGAGLSSDQQCAERHARQLDQHLAHVTRSFARCRRMPPACSGDSPPPRARAAGVAHVRCAPRRRPPDRAARARRVSPGNRKRPAAARAPNRQRRHSRSETATPRSSRATARGFEQVQRIAIGQAHVRDHHQRLHASCINRRFVPLRAWPLRTPPSPRG